MAAPAFELLPSEQSDRAAVDFEDLLPAWSYDKSVAAFATSQRLTGARQPSMSNCVGPAIKWARLATFILWGGTAICMWLSSHAAQCHEAGATIPSWLWIVYSPILLSCAALELLCCKFTLIPHVLVTRKFNLLGVNVGCTIWIIYNQFQSVLMRLDMATDAFFVTKLLQDEACSPQMSEIWSATIRQSMIPFLEGVRLSYVCFGLYALVLLQLLLPLLQSTEKTGQEVQYEIGRADPKLKQQMFVNLAGETAVLGDALMMLGEASHMMTLQAQSPDYPRTKARQALKEQQAFKALTLLRATLSRGVVSVGLVGLLENALQVHIQITIFAIKRYITDGETEQVQSAISIGLSVLMLSLKLLEAHDLLNFFGEVDSRIPTSASGSPGADTDAERLIKEYRRVRIYAWVLRLFVLLLFVAMAMAATKLAAVFSCEDSLWNIRGCVKLD